MNHFLNFYDKVLPICLGIGSLPKRFSSFKTTLRTQAFPTVGLTLLLLFPDYSTNILVHKMSKNSELKKKSKFSSAQVVKYLVLYNQLSKTPKYVVYITEDKKTSIH